MHEPLRSAQKKNGTNFGCFRKIMVSPNHPFQIGFSIMFTIHFGVPFSLPVFPNKEILSGHKVVAAAVAMPYFGAIPVCVFKPPNGRVSRVSFFWGEGGTW